MEKVGWLEFNVPFQHKYGYIRDDGEDTIEFSSTVLPALSPYLNKATDLRVKIR